MQKQQELTFYQGGHTGFSVISLTHTVYYTEYALKKLSEAKLLPVSNFDPPLQACAQKNQDESAVRATLLVLIREPMFAFQTLQTIPSANSSRELDKRRSTCTPTGTRRHKVI